MDELDKKLFEVLSEKRQTPNRCEYVIKNALKEKRSAKKIFKVAFTTCMVLALTTGGVIAGQKIYENIWKQPQKLETFYTPEGGRTPVAEEEKAEAITEEEAKEKAYEILKEYGYETEVIETIELINNPVDYDLFYQIKTNNKCVIEIDAINTENYKFFSNVLYNNIKDYRGTREELEKYVREFCANHGIDLTGHNYLKVNTNGLSEEDAYVWYFYFYKKYGDVVNRYEEISIGIIPEINKVYRIIVEQNPFDDNEIVITEEEAKQTVLETEKNIPTGKKIKQLHVDLDIARMNGFAYTRANNYEQYYEQTHTENYPIENILYHRTDNLVRRVWMVTVEYDVSEDNKRFADKYYTYFVDVTTGEIIGGNELYYTSKLSGQNIVTVL